MALCRNRCNPLHPSVPIPAWLHDTIRVEEAVAVAAAVVVVVRAAPHPHRLPQPERLRWLSLFCTRPHHSSAQPTLRTVNHRPYNPPRRNRASYPPPPQQSLNPVVVLRPLPLPPRNITLWLSAHHHHRTGCVQMRIQTVITVRTLHCSRVVPAVHHPLLVATDLPRILFIRNFIRNRSRRRHHQTRLHRLTPIG